MTGGHMISVDDCIDCSAVFTAVHSIFNGSYLRGKSSGADRAPQEVGHTISFLLHRIKSRVVSLWSYT